MTLASSLGVLLLVFFLVNGKLHALLCQLQPHSGYERNTGEKNRFGL